MPNWCFTQYAITGERREVRSLYNKMKRLQQRKTPLLPNSFGTAWLGCLVKSLGSDPEAVYCRGHWFNLSLDEDGTLYRIDEMYGVQYSGGEPIPDMGVKWDPDRVFSEIKKHENEHPKNFGSNLFTGSSAAPVRHPRE